MACRSGLLFSKPYKHRVYAQCLDIFSESINCAFMFPLFWLIQIDMRPYS